MPHSASPPPHQPRPPSAPPLPPPTLRLPTERRRHGAAALLASLAHGAILAVVLWRGAALLAGGGTGPGLRDGSSGSGPTARFFALPAFSAPRAFDVPAPPAITVSDIPLPDPAALKLPPVDVPRLAVAAAPPPGVATGPGTGGGGGGAPGTGAGTGSGGDVGAGRGGEGGYILIADPKGVIFPPECAPRGLYRLRFWVAADGRVTEVEIDPLPGDPACRRDFVGRMRAFKFAPARTRDGQPVASIYPVQITR